MTSTQAVGVLLAAGQSSRFGGDKSLHLLADGTPMAVASARRLRQACAQCVAVLRPDQVRLGQWLSAEGVQVVFDHAARDGMGRSLAEAVRATADAPAWVVALADMPFIQVDTMAAVVAALASGASIAAPSYQGRRGHPVGFSKRWFDSLSGLAGDQGARDILANHPEDLVSLDTSDRGVLIDIDTPAMLAEIEAPSA